MVAFNKPLYYRHLGFLLEKFASHLLFVRCKIRIFSTIKKMLSFFFFFPASLHNFKSLFQHILHFEQLEWGTQNNSIYSSYFEKELSRMRCSCVIQTPGRKLCKSNVMLDLDGTSYTKRSNLNIDLAPY